MSVGNLIFFYRVDDVFITKKIPYYNFCTRRSTIKRQSRQHYLILIADVAGRAEPFMTAVAHVAWFIYLAFRAP